MTSKNAHKPVLPVGDGRVYYWLPPSDLPRPDFIEQARNTEAELNIKENNRLLYVALTRARDGLVIGGWEKPNGVRRLDGSDYALLSKVIKTSKTAKALNWFSRLRKATGS